MKLLKNKTLNKLIGERVFYKQMSEIGQEIILDLLVRFIPEQIEITRQEMILNFKEQFK